MKKVIAVLMLIGSAAPLSAQVQGRASASASGRGAVVATQMPGAWIGIAFSCSDCSVQHDPAGARWKFTSPPEVYSVEPGSPAHTAGIRRGDVLTHIDDQSITTEQGGLRWAQIKPGEQVKLRYRRGAATGFATFTASEPRGQYAVARAQEATAQGRLFSEQRLQQAYADQVTRRQETLKELEEAQQVRMRQLQQYMSNLSADDRRRAEELLQTIVRNERQANEQQSRQFQELLRSNQPQTTRALTASDSVRGRAVTALRATPQVRGGSVAVTVPGEERLRYSGSIGGTDIEVRGVSPVVIEETAEELVIRIGDTIVRLKRAKQP